MIRVLAVTALMVVSSVALRAQTPGTAISEPKPAYPTDMKNHHIGGSGVFVLHVDVKTGKVRDVEVEKSTGRNELDTSALFALRHWRFLPNTTADKVRIPITFSPDSPPKKK